MRELLRRITGEVLDVGIVLQYAAEYLEERDVSRERVGDRLEHVERQRLAVHHMMDHFSRTIGNSRSAAIARRSVRHRMMFL